MNHLTEQSWRKLRAGTLEAAERAQLLGHLAEDCEQCDRLVQSLDDPALDCAVDAALASLPGEPAEVTFSTPTERAVLRQTFPSAGRKWLALAPIALAASLALVVVATPKVQQRLKGEVLKPPALTAVVSVQKGSALEPLASPRAYPSTAELYFTYDLPQDSHVYLGRVGVDGAVEPFYPPQGVSDAIERAGLHSLTVGGTVHAYALEGLRGKQRFVLISSPSALEGPALARALQEAAAPSASLEVQVQE